MPRGPLGRNVPAGVQAVYGDLDTEADLQRLPPRPDWLVFCATPDARDEAADDC